jgi:hypothetical protein
MSSTFCAWGFVDRPLPIPPLMNTNGVLLRTRRREPIHGPLGQPPRTVFAISGECESSSAGPTPSWHRSSRWLGRDHLWRHDTRSSFARVLVPWEISVPTRWRVCLVESPSMLHHRPGHEWISALIQSCKKLLPFWWDRVQLALSNFSLDGLHTYRTLRRNWRPPWSHYMLEDMNFLQ